MNLPTDETNQQVGAASHTSTVSGTVSVASNHSHQSDDENPLMRLVDAAVSASSREEAPMKKDNEVMTKESTGEDLKKDDSQVTNKPVSPEDSLEDAKVIRGTVQDLVGRSDKKATFAEYLMECLNDESNHDVLQWMPCGKQFTIVNHRKFTMERMPVLFKIRNMSSFVRKLTRWGFSRVHEKETGNSDIFKHENFQRDKPELCRKIRCVNRATAISQKPVIPLIMPPGSHVMGSDSESSLRRGPMVSPRRSMGPASTSPYGRPVYRYPHVPPHPRVSPEYEKEMIRDGRVPRAPPVYSPASMSAAAAEYELEQVLLQRQQARIYRERARGPSPPEVVDGSDRSHYSGEMLGVTSNSVVEAALDTLQREGSVDLDMSPREAMLRAMLHKRQQQRQQQQGRGAGAGGGGILRHGSAYPDAAPRHPSSYYR